jgi:hypothetical protein
MGRRRGAQARIELDRRRARGLPQRVDRIEHPELDLVRIARADPVDLRQRPPVRPICGGGGAQAASAARTSIAGRKGRLIGRTLRCADASYRFVPRVQTRSSACAS